MQAKRKIKSETTLLTWNEDKQNIACADHHVLCAVFCKEHETFKILEIFRNHLRKVMLCIILNIVGFIAVFDFKDVCSLLGTALDLNQKQKSYFF